MSEKLKEEIKYSTEWLRFIFIVYMAICSSILSFITNEAITISRIIFVVLGIFFIFGLSIIVIYLDDKIRVKLKKLMIWKG